MLARASVKDARSRFACRWVQRVAGYCARSCWKARCSRSAAPLGYGPRPAAEPRSGHIPRNQPGHNSSGDRGGLARASVCRGNGDCDVPPLRHDSRSAQHNTEPLTSLKSGERGVVGNRERFSAQRLMVISQIAVSMVLLFGALLFVRSYRNLLTLNPGVRERGMTAGYLGFPSAIYQARKSCGLQAATGRRSAYLPGIEDAAGAHERSFSAVPPGATKWRSVR